MPAVPPSSTLIPLDYAPVPPRWRKRARRIVCGLTLLAMVFCAWRWGPYAWHQSQLLYWQWRCVNFTASPDTVVYEEEPGAAALLLKRLDYSPYVLHRRLDFDSPAHKVQAAAFYPQCWRTLDTMAMLSARNSFIGSNGLNGGGVGAIIFLHERTSAAGRPKLVCVNYMEDTYGFNGTFVRGNNYVECVASPATWTKPLTPSQCGWQLSLRIEFPTHAPLARVYAGQADPNDPAHFTIRYQMWGQEDFLDGRLQDNDYGGYVTLKQRHPPKEPKD